MQYRLSEKRLNHNRNFSSARAVALGSVTAGLLLLLSQSGCFQSMEVKTFDLLTRLTTQPHLSDTKDLAQRLVIVAITEEDIQSQKQWPLSDQAFAQLLAQLQRHSPEVIGLDIYRDIPHAPGTDALTAQLQKDNVITITNLNGLGGVAVPSPLQVPDSRVGFNDFVVDPDGVIRRNFMFAVLDDRHLYSFSLRLVEKFLAARGDKIEAEADALNIGDKRLLRLTPNVGGYQSIDAEGYQLLSRYLPPGDVARQLSLTQVLDGEFDPAWITGNVVLIGTTAPSQKDLFYTPFSSSNDVDLLMPGVVLHAQMTQQMLSAILDGRDLLRGWPQWAEVFWVWGWGIVGALVAWRLTHPGVLAVGTLAGGVGLSAVTLVLFTQSVWVPLAL
ncbi:MAG: CHASE2 domain-containing protein, partial [Cyanobacteria bacterium J06649_4]